MPAETLEFEEPVAILLMQEDAVYSVIPPEGCAAILWRDAARKVEAAEALKITAPDLLALHR